MYNSNQYSQIVITSTQLTGDQWIGPSVRMQSDGQSGYAGVYSWNNGDPGFILYKRAGKTWRQIGDTYACGALAAGTTLKLMAVGNTLAFMENGVERIAVYDNSYVGGAPRNRGTWRRTGRQLVRRDSRFEVHYLSTDSNGVEIYDMISANNGYGPQLLRVLRPTNPTHGVAHNFLFVLPVESGEGANFGDGMKTLDSLDAQNQYNLTIVEPSFAIDPWYADNPTNPNVQQEHS